MPDRLSRRENLERMKKIDRIDGDYIYYKDGTKTKMTKIEKEDIGRLEK